MPDHHSTSSHKHSSNPLPIALRHTLQLILLLDRIAITASLSRIDQLFCQALRNALHVPERGFSGTDGKKGDGLIDTTERRDVDGLATDGSSRADTGAVFSGAAVDNGVDGHLDGVLVGHDVDLTKRARSAMLIYSSYRRLKYSMDLASSNAICDQRVGTYNLKGVGNDPNSHQLLSVVSSIHH